MRWGQAVAGISRCRAIWAPNDFLYSRSVFQQLLCPT